MTRSKSNSLVFYTVGLFILGVLLRVWGLGFVSNDMRIFLLDWYNELARGGFSALHGDFSNYTPAYLYLLWLSTPLSALITKVAVIKSISVLFDIVNVFWVYQIIYHLRRDRSIAWMGAGIFFCLPTIVLNAAWWGQADSIYTCFLLGCLYFLLLDRPLPAMILYGIAFSFKFQAFFLAPFFLLLLLKRRIPWMYILLVPLVYVVMVLPAVMAGRPLMDALTIYLAQADLNRRLTSNAPNLYQFLPTASYAPVLYIGLGFTFVLALVWAIGYSRRIKTISAEILLVCAAASALLAPFLLPKMHDRYFYVADVITLLIAFALPRQWLVPLASQTVSIISYTIYLTALKDRGLPVIESPTPIPMLLATLVNTALVVYVFLIQYRLTGSPLNDGIGNTVEQHVGS